MATELDLETGSPDPRGVKLDLDPEWGKTPEPKALDLSTKIDGDGIPEELRGKTVAEALAYAEALKKGLAISEDARKQMAAPVAQPAPVQAPVYHPQPIPEPTPEQIREAFEKDPVATVQALQQLQAAKTSQQWEARMRPLMEGLPANAELLAKAEFAEDFELFGDQIRAAVQMIPDPIARGNIESWRHVVAYVRGQPQNLEKLLAKKMEKANGTTIQAQQALQALGTPGHFTPSQRTAAPIPGVAQLDEAELAIMKELEPYTGIKTAEEWNKWKR